MLFSEPNEAQTLLLFLALAAVLVLLVTAILLLLRVAARPRWFLTDPTSFTSSSGPPVQMTWHGGGGPRCGHCGTLFTAQPVREVALENQSLLVYTCAQCGKETALSSADLE